MNRQITKGISSYFPIISKKLADIQTSKEFLSLKIAEQQVIEQAITEEEKVNDDPAIDYRSAYLEQFDDDDDEESIPKRTMRREARPDNWREIVREFNLNGYTGLRRVFPEFFINESGEQISEDCLRKRLSRYRKDIKRTHPQKSRGGQIPPYGMAIDNELFLEVKHRRLASLPVNDIDLHNMLLTLLQKNNMSDLLVENGGKHIFGQSWARRFCKRHDLTNRVPTSKARENPTDFDAKVNKYINILAIAIHSHNVPAELVINCDETSLNFVSNAKKTREVKGTRKVRMCGVGRDKAQITCTLACTESGEILKPQLIFAGKTNRCCPSTRKDYLYCFTKSHWQNGDSYVEFLKGVIIPYKIRKVRELGLPDDQWCVLIHDLHCSHLTTEVKEFSKNHNIALVHIPAGCTDSLQVCDTVINSPFKAGARIGFKKLISKCYDDHVNAGNLPQFFEMNLNPGYLKNFISDFVAAGISAVSSNEMKMSIMNAFQNHARLSEARKVERYQVALAEVPVIDDSESLSEDTSDEIPGFSSSEDDNKPLVLRFKAAKRTNLSLVTNSK